MYLVVDSTHTAVGLVTRAGLTVWNSIIAQWTQKFRVWFW